MPPVAKALEKEAKAKGGRPPGPSGHTLRSLRQVQTLFRGHAEEALATMLRIMRDETADKAVRLKAANDLLNRGFGTPVSTQVIATLDRSEVQSTISPTVLASTSTQDLVAAIELIKRFSTAGGSIEDAEVVDVTPEDDEP